MDKTCSSPNANDVYFTPFTEGKIRWWFDLLDVNKDASMSRADFDLVADRFVKEYSLDEAKAEEIRDWLVRGWDMVMVMDKEESEEEIKRHMPMVVKVREELRAGHKIMQDDFTVAYEQVIKHSPKLAKLTLATMVNVFFDIFDHDHDGYMSKQDMVVAMRCFGLDEPGVVETAFTCLDLDKDGRLSRTEYVDGWTNFILGQDKQHAFVVAFAPHLQDLENVMS